MPLSPGLAGATVAVPVTEGPSGTQNEEVVAGVAPVGPGGHGIITAGARLLSFISSNVTSQTVTWT